MDASESVHVALRTALTEGAATRQHGVLEVTGRPGGDVFLADGEVTGIRTPGAPSAEVIFLRSGLLTEADWDEAFTAAAVADGSVASQIVARGIVGAGELEALLRTAIADAMFVMTAGEIDRCRVVRDTADYPLPLQPGAEVGPLLAETSRRLLNLASPHGLPAPGRERMIAVPGKARQGVTLGFGQDEILALADGRRTTRDIAFALGRGVYATALRMAQMRAAGLLVPVPSHPASGPAASPNYPPRGSQELPGGLPQREKGGSALPHRTSAPRDNRSPQGLQRLLRPRPARGSEHGEVD